MTKAPERLWAAAEKLANEYRPTMDKDVLHSWAIDAVVALNALTAERDMLGDAVSLIRGIKENGERWTGADICDDCFGPTVGDDAIAEILNAVCDGRLVIFADVKERADG